MTDTVTDPYAGMTHGLPGTYVQGCRCPACTAVNTTRQASTRDRLEALGAEHPELIPHGLNGYNNWRHRCPVCVAGHATEMARQRGKRKLFAGRPLADLSTRERDALRPGDIEHCAAKAAARASG